MSHYFYKARDDKGQLREGTIEADTAAAEAALRRSLVRLKVAGKLRRRRGQTHTSQWERDGL